MSSSGEITRAIATSDADRETVLRTDRSIRQIARGLAVSGCDADDIQQDTWLALVRDGAAGLEPSKGWLARVASNFLRRRYRESSRRSRRERLVSRPESDSSRLPHKAIERFEQRRVVTEAVLALREPYRSTVVLRFFHDLSLKEVAARQGISLNTVKTRISRALELLRRRLDRPCGGGRAAWSCLLVPLGRPGAASRAASWFGLKPAGIVTVSAKMFVVATCVSIVVVTGLGVAIHRGDRHSPDNVRQRSGASVRANVSERSTGSDDLPALEPRVSAPVVESLESAPRPAIETVGGSAPLDETQSAEATAASLPRPIAPEALSSAEALRTRNAFAAVKKRFGEGGRRGWTDVGKNVGPLQDLLLSSEEGFAEFLALLDEENDAAFLEALMHHLPLADTESRPEILADDMLHEEIWARFGEAENAGRRLAFLRFFAFNRELSASRMGTFLELATSEKAENVRQLSVDAIASNRDLIDDTWETLVDVFENDSSSACRETAIAGLAFARAEQAAQLVSDALRSTDENLRAAALNSRAGEELAIELTGGDAVAYLVAELRAASGRRYKMAVVDRLLELSPETLDSEIRRALADEKDWSVKKHYRDALERIAAGRKARDA